MISLRPIDDSDAAAAFDAIMESVKETSPWIGILNEKLTLNDLVLHFSEEQNLRRERREYNFSVIDTDSNAFVGGCGLNHINWNHGNANLFYWIRTSRTGKGFATQAVCQTAQFGFDTLGLIRVELIIAVGNNASIRVAEKSGATREGKMRSKLRTGETVQDAIMYSLLSADLRRNAR